MHEFSIAIGIAGVALEAAEKHKASTVSIVEVNVGVAAGVVAEALDFAWESIRKDTLLEHAVLKINTIPLQLHCNDCGELFHASETFDPCPTCKGWVTTVVTGKELKVISIET
jgi:hydrogenase nickel incorporation protein HypA/HybF